MPTDTRNKTVRTCAMDGGWTGAACDSATYPSPVTSSLVLSDSRTHVDNPNYKKQIANGQNATTNFTGILRSFESAPLISQYYLNTYGNPVPVDGKRKRYRYSNHGVTVPANGPAAAVQTSADNRARTSFYKQAYEQMSAFQGGTALGELAETVRMIKSPLKSLRSGIDDYLRDLKKGRRGSPARKKSFLADTWLEYSFGWAPLINDIESAVEYAQKQRKRAAVDLIKIKGTGSADTVTFTPITYTDFSCYTTGHIKNTAHTTVRYKGAVRKEGAFKEYSIESLGLGLKNFVPTLWELLPYSFLIDYFTNIGDLITAHSIGPVRLAWGCKTLRGDSTNESNSFYHIPNPAVYFYERYLYPGRTTATRHAIVRTSVNDVELPTFQFETPGTSTKFLNLAALAASRSRMRPF